ncbi:MAG: hypothetical protein HY835_03335 [Anaerolineae bacterium]|nr:hypothetical protein [Anaerolineae bacterium]
MNSILLENQSIRLEFSRQTGALIRLYAPRTGWKIFDRPELGLAFRLLVPISDELRNNPVLGEKQTLSSYSQALDSSSITFVWDSVESEVGGKLDIHLELTVSLLEDQAVFFMKVENHSGYVVENVYCPYIGDIKHPANEAYFKTFTYQYDSAAEQSIWPAFQNTRGYYGVDHPTLLGGAPCLATPPQAPFILLRGELQGLYVGVRERSYEVVAWMLELLPGYESSIDSRVPEKDINANQPVCTRFAAVHVPMIQPGETRYLTPIAIATYTGGWHAGVDLYKRWRESWMRLPQLPDWVTEPHAWQQIQMNSPEDELRISYRELVEVGRECARHGVRAIQLVGWNDGGQDQGNPSHSTDPRLGSADEFKQAISEIQDMGIKVVLFTKFIWADRASEWYRQSLRNLAVKDPYGDDYVYSGYQYQTVTQLLDINTRRLIPMCFLSDDWMKICEAEFKKVLDLGADGILHDESSWHGQALQCFDVSHEHRYGAPIFAGDNALIQRFSRLSAIKQPDYLYAGEANWDWMYDTYHLSYHRSENKKHVPLMRYLQPHGLLMTAVTGFNDRNMINQCLMYRYIISYEPYNFKGRLADFPATLAYGQKMDALRTELRDFFWEGEFLDTVGVEVRHGAEIHHPYAVYRNAKTGAIGLVICNYDEKNQITVNVRVPDGALSLYRLVDEPRWISVENEINIPPQSAVVVV